MGKGWGGGGGEQRRGSGKGKRKEKHSGAKEFFFYFSSLSFNLSFYLSPPLLLSWELSFELLELFGDAVSVYQFVCVCVCRRVHVCGRW